METTFNSGGIDIDVEVFRPTGAPNGGVIIIAHGSDGMREPWGPMIRGYGEDLASQGFIALIPRYFQSTNTPDERGSIELATVAPPLRRDEWQAALANCVAQAKTLASVDTVRIGLLGFSLGGHLCLRLRSLSSALVAFFAPEFPAFGGIGTSGNPALRALIHHGEADRQDLVPLKPNAESIQRKLLKEGATAKVISYPDAGHGFLKRMVNGRDMGGSDEGNSKADALANAETLQFFKDSL